MTRALSAPAAFIAALVVVQVPHAYAQGPGRIQDRGSDPAQVAALLQSTDPREQAWGAWFSSRDVMP
jgi:hypothetical protein